MTDADRAALARLFEYFAKRECSDDPLYAVLCRLIAARTDLLALLGHAPPTQRIPNLLLAALHERVLAGVQHPFAAYFPSAGGTREPDAALAAALDDFVSVQHESLVTLLATRNTQTNEIGRCAVLWPSLCALAQRMQCECLALLDFGCSAGLNLGVDRYRYAYGGFALGAAPAPGVPVIDCCALGASSAALRALQGSVPRLVVRIGVDPAAVDVSDAAQVRWLRACLWPYDRMRAERFDAAVALAQRERFVVQRCDDCFAAIGPWLDSLPTGVQPVVFNSWVLHYFDPPSRLVLAERLRALVQSHSIAWLSAEGAHLALQAPLAFSPVGDAIVSDEQVAKGTQWWLTLPGRSQPEAVLLARSHPHGRWLQWLA
jgi:hypothetical protein